jgi:hypothetical protein
MRFSHSVRARWQLKSIGFDSSAFVWSPYLPDLAKNSNLEIGLKAEIRVDSTCLEAEKVDLRP